MAQGLTGTREAVRDTPENPAPQQYALQLRDVWLRLGREVILRGVDLDVMVGEGVKLLGENGAGKTTLLRLLATVFGPTRGEGRVMGFDMKDTRSVRDFIHLMPVDGALYPDLTCVENLEFALQMHGQTGDIAGVLERVNLTHAAGRRVRYLSAGMRKRLALARAFLLARPLTLVDEPFANLDDAGRKLVLELLGELRAEKQVTLIVAAHEPELAKRLAPRTLRLGAGKLVEE